MNCNCFNDLLKKVESYIYDEQEIIKITNAYLCAQKLHAGQKRQSGEDYISHPLNVAFILANYHADADTIAAALLHDVIEDTIITKEEIATSFGPVVAHLVDGVTNINVVDAKSIEEALAIDTRRIITSINEDPRIVIIKLADRLHNMRTLQVKSKFKQKENALETIEIYTPIADYIGAHEMESELEDLSLQYLRPKVYLGLSDKIKKIITESQKIISEMADDISLSLDNESINNVINIRIKHIYGIYKRLEANRALTSIHDLFALKIIVDDVDECYQALRIIHHKYPPRHDKFKDYIALPKINMYQSLHTTVIGPNGYLIQNQIRTSQMDQTANCGLMAHWFENNNQAINLMKNDISNNFQFAKSLVALNEVTIDNKEFVNQIKHELFTDNIYVYTPQGHVFEMPNGSTVIDFAYKVHTEVGNNMTGATVNNAPVPFNHRLKTKDCVSIITNNLSSGPKKEWLDLAYTSYAKQKIKKYIDEKNKHF